MSEYVMNKALESVSGEQWLQDMRAQFRGVDRGDEVFSLSAIGYMPELVVENDMPLSGSEYSEIRKEGGFFDPITKENQNHAIRTIFADFNDKGQWLIDVLESEPEMAMQFLQGSKATIDTLSAVSEKHNLTNEQRAFLHAYHEFEVITFRLSGDQNGYDMARYPTDGVITVGEVYDIMQNRLHKTTTAQLGDYRVPLAQYIGGIAQGRADIDLIDRNGFDQRHIPEELEVLPPVVRAFVNHGLLITEVPERALFVRDNEWKEDVANANSAGLMFIDSVCSSITTHQFSHDTERAGLER